MIEQVDHVNLVVADLAAMTSFYERAFGLRVTKRATIRGSWIEAATGYGPVEADVVYLEAECGAAVELIAYRRPAGRRPEGLGEPNCPGLRHVAFRVRDVEQAAAAAEKAGAELLSPVQTVPDGQVDFGGQRKRLVYCRDPEGNLLELCEYRPCQPAGP